MSRLFSNNPFFPTYYKARSQALSRTRGPKMMLSEAVQKDSRLALTMTTIENIYWMQTKTACTLLRKKPCSSLVKKTKDNQPKKEKAQVGLFLDTNRFSPSYSTHATWTTSESHQQMFAVDSAARCACSRFPIICAVVFCTLMYIWNQQLLMWTIDILKYTCLKGQAPLHSQLLRLCFKCL